MLRDDVVALIGQKLGWRTDKDTQIVTALKQAQEDFEAGALSFLPWFMQSAVTGLSTVASTETVALPTGFVKEFDRGSLWKYISTNDAGEQWTQLGKSDYDAMIDKYEDTEDEPLVYDLIGELFYLRPIPDAVYTLKAIIHEEQTVLDTNIENNWLKYGGKVMRGEAGFNLAQDLRDAEAIAFFDTMRQAGKDALWRMHEAREHENQRYIMGGED